MSARDVISRMLCCGDDGVSREDRCSASCSGIASKMANADAILAALHAAGYVVAKVPDRATPGTVPWRYGDEWAGVQDGASEESLDLICNGYADGWNACRAAMLASSEPVVAAACAAMERKPHD